MRVFILVFFYLMRVGMNADVFESDYLLISKLHCDDPSLRRLFPDECRLTSKSLLPGQSIQQSSESCSYGLQISDSSLVCKGFPHQHPCKSHADCNSGLYCKEVCLPQIESGQTGCESDFECENTSQCINKTCVLYISDPSKSKEDKDFYRKLQDTWKNTHTLTRLSIDLISRRRRTSETYLGGYHVVDTQSYDASIYEGLDIESIGPNKLIAYFISGADFYLYFIEEDGYTQELFGTGYRPKIIKLANEKYLISSVSDTPTQDMLVQIRNSEDNTVEHNMEIIYDIYGVQFLPFPVGLPSGSFALFWTKDNMVFAENEVYSRFYHPDTTPITDELTLSENGLRDITPSADCNQDGKVMVLWVELNNSYIYYVIHSKVFDSVGNVVGPASAINSPGIGNLPFFAISDLSDNNFIAIWTEITNQIHRITGQVRDSSNDEITSLMVLHENPDSSLYIINLDVKGLNEGGFAVVWQVQSPDQSQNAIFARTFDSSYQAMGPSFQLSKTASSASLPAISLQQDSLVFAWKTSSSLVIARASKCTISGCINCSISIDICQECSSDSTECYVCHDHCVTCSGASSNQCLSCTSTAHLDNGQCLCSEGSYNASADALECQECDDNCKTCSQADACTSCHNNMVLEDNHCTCTAGNYLDNDRCLECSEHCLDCRNLAECNICTGELEIVSGVCECPTGKYIKNGNCLQCGNHCERCTDDNTCLECHSQIPLIDGLCQCEENQYVSEGECKDCPQKCSECIGESTCTGCAEPFVLVNGNCECDSGYFESNLNCLDCPNFCSICTDEYICTECASTFLLKNDSCVCPESYSLNATSCYYSRFDCSFSKNSDYLSLIFSENLASPLALSRIPETYFLPSTSSFTLSINSLSSSDYELRIESTEVPSDTIGLYIEFEELVSESGKTLKSENLANELIMEASDIECLVIEEEETEVLPIGVSSENTALGVAAAGGSASIGISLISANPSTIWMFLNLVILIYYMPLQNVPMPVEIQEFSKGFAFDILEIIPGLDKVPAFNSSDANPPPDMWSSYGIKTTDFLTNASNFIIFFCIGIFFLFLATVLFLIFHKNQGKCKNVIEKGIRSFKWCFFLRLYIQTFLKLIVASVLSISTIDSQGYGFQQIASIIMIGFGFFSIYWILRTTYLKREEIASKNNISSIETFYYEFKCDRGFKSMLYYPLFLLRRLTYIMGIYFLEEYPLVQVVINSSFSLLVLVYLIIYRPFIDSSANLVNIFTEIIITIMFCTCGLFLIDLSEDAETYISKFMFACALLLIVAVVGSCLYKIIKAIRKCRNKKKQRVISLKVLETSTVLKSPKFQENAQISERKYNDLFVNRVVEINNGRKRRNGFISQIY